MFPVNCIVLTCFIGVCDASVYTCDEGTWARPDQWGYGASSVLVGSGFCWTQSYFCSLKGRTPVEEEKSDNENKRVSESMKVKLPAAAETNFAVQS